MQNILNKGVQVLCMLFFPDVNMYIYVKINAHKMVMQYEVYCNFCEYMMYLK